MNFRDQVTQLLIAAVDSVNSGEGRQVAKGMWEISLGNLGNQGPRLLGAEAPIAAVPLYVLEGASKQSLHTASKERTAVIAVCPNTYAINYERSWARFQTYFASKPATAEATTLVVKGVRLPAIWLKDRAPSGPLVLAPATDRFKPVGSEVLRDHLLKMLSGEVGATTEAD